MSEKQFDKRGEVEIGYYVEIKRGSWAKEDGKLAQTFPAGGLSYSGSITKEQMEGLDGLIRGYLEGNTSSSHVAPSGCDVCGALPGRSMTATICQQEREDRKTTPSTTPQKPDCEGRVPTRSEMVLDMDVDAIKDAIGKAYPSLDDMTRETLWGKVDRLHDRAFNNLFAKPGTPELAALIEKLDDIEDDGSAGMPWSQEELDLILAALRCSASATPRSALPWTPEETARRFHDAYELFAPAFGWATQESSRKPWDELPNTIRALMIAVVRNVLIEQAQNNAADGSAEKKLPPAYYSDPRADE